MFVEEQGLTCSELCSDFGCWGPGDDNCVSCRNYSMKGRCVNNCTMQLGFYSFTTEDGILECGKCHEECLLECTGGVCSLHQLHRLLIVITVLKVTFLVKIKKRGLL